VDVDNCPVSVLRFAVKHNYRDLMDIAALMTLKMEYMTTVEPELEFNVAAQLAWVGSSWTLSPVRKY
jgi:hypothetical protein